MPLPAGGRVEFRFGDHTPPEIIPVADGEAVSPVHAYAAAGTYTVTMLVTNAAGAYWGQARYVKIAPRAGGPGDIPDPERR